MREPRGTGGLLVALLLLDVVLTATAFGWPELWFRFFHGSVAPADLLYFRRAGAQWAGFALVQAIALVRWRRDRRWLAAVAGVRLCDVFTDVTALALMPQRTAFAWIALASTGPMNAIVAALLFRRAREHTVP